MIVYHVSLSPSQQQLHITRRGDRGEWFSSVEGRRARYSSFVGGEGGMVGSLEQVWSIRWQGTLDNNGGKECRGRGLAFFSLRRKGSAGG